MCCNILTSVALPRSHPLSPSHKMATLSHQLSVTSVHQELPFGSPPTSVLAKTFDEVPWPETGKGGNEATDQGHEQESFGRTESRSAAASSSIYSTFSCAGDSLPDETAEDTVRNLPAFDDTEEVLRMANLIAQKRGIKADILVPRILKLCDDTTSIATTDEPEQDVHEDVPLSSVSVYPRTCSRTVPVFSLPNGRVSNTPRRRSRRFSFDFGDDSGFGSLQSDSRTSTLYAPGPPRRSQSAMDHLTINSNQSQKSEDYDRSPLLSRSSSLLASSMIPAPASKSPLARPRREGSSSGILDVVSQQPNSSENSRAQSRAGSRADRMSRGSESEASQVSQEPSQRTSVASFTPSGGKRLVQGMQLLRSNSLAIAAARTASNGSNSSPSNEG